MKGMKIVGLIFNKRLVLALCVIMLVGFLPLSATAADVAPGVNITAVKDLTGVTATINNTTAASCTASLIFAVYDQNGRLSYSKEYPITVAANSSANQKFDFDFVAKPDGILKLFAWNSVGFIPLSKERMSCLSITIDGSGVVYDGIGVNVSAAPTVKEFQFVMIDEFTKRGGAYTATKLSNKWSHVKTEGVDVVIAYKPTEFIGSALPDMEITDLRMPNGLNQTRVIISQ
jgi:hypothetical protein